MAIKLNRNGFLLGRWMIKSLEQTRNSSVLISQQGLRIFKSTSQICKEVEAGTTRFHMKGMVLMSEKRFYPTTSIKTHKWDQKMISIIRNSMLYLTKLRWLEAFLSLLQKIISWIVARIGRALSISTTKTNQSITKRQANGINLSLFFR